MKKFNVTGLCVPDKHYMADTSAKMAEIRKMIDDGAYFTINRARQYGKTTTLSLLRRTLPSPYVCAQISFEGVGESLFESEERFCEVFKDLLSRAFRFSSLDEEGQAEWQAIKTHKLKELSDSLSAFCKGRKIVLLVDEVDKACNNQVFLHFLGMLRDKYLLRQDSMDYTFHSVILAGVYDIKNIKLKMEQDGHYKKTPESEKKYNSPWNIASDFKIDMALEPTEIITMLTEYENDHHSGMDIAGISQGIYDYTGGYPFLVSRVCQCIDQELHKDWTINGIEQAVKIIVDEHNVLLDDLAKNMENNPGLYDLLREMLFTDFIQPVSFMTPDISLGLMLGLLNRKNGQLTVSNVIFETFIYNYIIQKNRAAFRGKTDSYYHSPFVSNGLLDMELILRKFSEFMYEEYREADAKFIEQNGMLLFLSFLKPIVNGKGFAFVEAQTRQNKRMDVVVTYAEQRFIVELKIWYGNAGHEAAYDQLLEYMHFKSFAEGYLLTFDFRKGQNKARKAEWVQIGDKRIFDVVV